MGGRLAGDTTQTATEDTARATSRAGPTPEPQPVPAPPSPMQPPSHHQPAQPINDSESQVNLAQGASKNVEEEDQVSNYTGTSYDPS